MKDTESKTKENLPQKTVMKQTKISFSKNVMPTFVKIVKDKDTLEEVENKSYKKCKNTDIIKINLTKTVNGFSSPKSDLTKSSKTVNVEKHQSDKQKTLHSKQKKQEVIDLDDEPLAALKKQISDMDDEDMPLSKVKSLKSPLMKNLPSQNHDSIVISDTERTPKKSETNASSNQSMVNTPKAPDILSLNVRQSPRIKKLAAEKKILEEKLQREKEEAEAIARKKREKKKLEQAKKAAIELTKAIPKVNSSSDEHRKINGVSNIKKVPPLTIRPMPVSSAQPVQPVVVQPNTAKHIVIAIDMNPEKWKSLSQEEQQKIIEEKKEIARKHLLSLNKVPVVPPMKPLTSYNVQPSKQIPLIPKGNQKQYIFSQAKPNINYDKPIVISPIKGNVNISKGNLVSPSISKHMISLPPGVKNINQQIIVSRNSYISNPSSAFQVKTPLIQPSKITNCSNKNLIPLNKSPITANKDIIKVKSPFNTNSNIMVNKSPIPMNKNVIVNKSSSQLQSSLNSQHLKNITQVQTQISPAKVVSQQPIVQLNRQINSQQFGYLQQKVEDASLFGLKAIPRAKVIPMPPGISNQMFGDMAMVVEFVNAFQKFLMSDENLIVTIDKLMNGLSTLGKDTDAISNILLLFLKVVLGNEDYKIKGLKIELADLPLTEYTVSYLVCQFLKSQLEKKRKEKRAAEIAAEYAAAAAKKAKLLEDGDSSQLDDTLEGEDFWIDIDEEEEKKKKKKKMKAKEEFDDEWQLRNICNELEAKEFYALPSPDQLYVLVYLLNLILSSEDILEYYEQIQNERSDAFRDLDSYRKEKAKIRREKEEEKLKELMKQNTIQFPKIQQVNGEKVDEKKTDDENEKKIDEENKKKTEEEKRKKTDEENKDTESKKDNEDQNEATVADLKDKKNNSNNNKDETKKTQSENKEKNELKSEKEEKTKEECEKTKEQNEKPKVEEKKSDVVKIDSDSDEENIELKKLSSKLADTDPYSGMTQRQIDALKSEAERDAKRKLEEKRKLEQAEKEEEMKLTGKVTELSNIFRRACRLQPIGYDRFYRMYWLFQNGIPGLFVSEADTFQGTSEGVKDRWRYYNKKEEIDELLSALTSLGIREERLKVKLRSHYDSLLINLKTNKKTEKTETKSDSNNSERKTETTDCKPAEEKNEQGKKEPEIKENIKELPKNELSENKEKPTSDVGNDKTEKVEEKKKDEDTLANAENINSMFKAEKSVPNIHGETPASVVSEEKTVSLNTGEKPVSLENGERPVSVVNGEKPISVVNGEKPVSPVNVEKPATEMNGDKKVSLINGDKTVSDNNGEQVSSKSEEVVEIDSKTSNDKSKLQSRYHEAFMASVEALKTDLIESAQKIAKGSLGELPSLDEWIENVKMVTDLNTLKDYVLQIQSCIFHKFFIPPMDGVQDSSVVEEWCRSVEKASTLSKLHTLYGILENSVKWEKSVENMRCKGCRRTKGSREGDRIIVCDKCNHGYHCYCIRPPVLYLPEGQWTCPTCKPLELRSTRSKKSYNEEHLVKMNENETEESDHEESCHVCNGHGILILCDSCPLSFHFDCHNPPLRRAPRGYWSCQECRNKSKRNQDIKKGKYKEVDTDSEESEIEEPIEEEPKTKKKKKLETTKNNKKNDKNKKESKQNKRTHISDCSDSEDESQTVVSKKRKFTRNKKSEQTNHEWNEENTDSISPILGIKRPRYAKDGVKSDEIKETDKPKKSRKESIKTVTVKNDIPKKKNNTSYSIDRNVRSARRRKRDENDDMFACKSIVIELRKHEDAWPFLSPVDTSVTDDYLEIVRQPMDLATVLENINAYKYEDALQCIDDVKLIFSNSKLYNQDASDVGEAGLRLKEEFDRLLSVYLPGLL